MLGPLELWAHGRTHRLGSPQERRVLAVLLMAEGRAVPVDRLIDHVWDGTPPPSAVETLQSYISRLRGRLRGAGGDAPQLDASSSRMYTLRVAPDAVDLLEFRRLCRQARQAVDRGDAEDAVRLFRQAEALRRAEPLADLTGLWAASVRERLREELREATETRIRLELSLGRHAHLISELKELAASSPVVEPVVADLMIALYRCGRPGEALAAYRTARRRLLDELGLEPGRDLQAVHERVLRGDQDLLRPAAPPRPRLAPLDNLLRDISDFTGREEEIRLLVAELDSPATPTALPLAVVHGMPGVGKTQLAVRVANLLRERHPDRLYLNLRAHGPQGPLGPGAALSGLLTALGLAPDKLPSGLEERAALWRESMARRRAIVVLDDAADAAQVRPLLPGTPGCSVLVTSRHRLTDLEGALSLALDVPSPAQAAQLFTRIVGPGRITDRAALRRTVDLCGCHPLGLRMIAARLHHRVGWDIEDLADRLEQAGSVLDEIDGPAGAPTGIGAAFRLCYAELEPDQQHLFRRLALHPGPDLAVDVAAALAGGPGGLPGDRVRRGVDALLDAHLVEESGRDRIRAHDLVREFALRTAEREDSPAERDAALRRMLDHYLAQAHHADRLAHPHHPRLDQLPPHTGVEAAETGLPGAPGTWDGTPPGAGIRTADEGEAWLDLERTNLLAAARLAAARSPHHAVLFPHVLAHSFLSWGAWEAGAELYATALTFAQDRGDDATTGQLTVEMASLLWSQGAHDDALRHARRALDIGERHHREDIQAQALFEMGRCHLISARRAEATACFDRALALHRASGSRKGEGDTLRLLGIALSHAGRNQEAAERFRAALEIQTAIGDKRGQVRALNNIGEIARQMGHPDEARGYYERSLALVRVIGGKPELSDLYANFGTTFRADGDMEKALSFYRRALDTYRETGDPRGEADVLISLGTTYLEAGSPAEARLNFQMAEHVSERIGDRYARQRALVGTAYTQLASRQYGLATATFEEALRVGEEIDIPLAIGQALEGLGQVAEATQGAAAAHDYFARALDVYRTLGLPEAETVRARLEAPGAAGS